MQIVESHLSSGRNFWRHSLLFQTLAVLLVFCWLPLPGNGETPPGQSLPARNEQWSGATMGTTFTIKIVGARLSDIQLSHLKGEITALLAEINRQISHYQPDSELSRFNAAEAGVPFKISSHLARILRFSIDLWRNSNGAFDPTLGQLINLWGFGQKGRRTSPPSAEEIEAAKRLCGCEHLSLSPDNILTKDIAGLQLNLSAVGQGFGAEECGRVMRSHGITNFFIELGGEILASGTNHLGTPWRVGVEAPDPAAGPGQIISLVVPLSNSALATSGDYREFFEAEDGKRYSHHLNPKTGRPLHTPVLSVVVVAPDCLPADGYGTTLLVLGLEEGTRWIERQPGAGAMFMVSTPDGGLRRVTTSRFPKFSTPESEK